ncbi:MAG: DUF1573 domain-containing protein [Ignavibacteriae bacterium]|nr:DUF1573 domain-containing protein [Ignavibacteriota bacterium]
MKTITIFILTVLLASSSLTYSKEKPAKIKFREVTHDFGKVEEGTRLSYSYKFKNTGKGTLIIESVIASCGCTGAALDGKNEYSRNERGEIKVTFNTRGREGVQTKTVTVRTNDPTDPQVVLTFTCEVLKKD